MHNITLDKIVPRQWTANLVKSNAHCSTLWSVLSGSAASASVDRPLLHGAWCDAATLRRVFATLSSQTLASMVMVEVLAEKLALSLRLGSGGAAGPGIVGVLPSAVRTALTAGDEQLAFGARCYSFTLGDAASAAARTPGPTAAALDR